MIEQLQILRQKMERYRLVRTLGWEAQLLLGGAAKGEGRAEERKAPVFVVGCPHSGTSLTLAILDGHQNIHAVPGETRIFLEPSLASRHALVRGWLIRSFEAECRVRGRGRWAEKTPYHFYAVDRIREELPGTRFLWVMRDPRDVYFSLRERGFSEKEALKNWIAAEKEQARQDGSEDILFFRYEDLVRETEGMLQRICGFLEEPYDPELQRIEERGKNWYGAMPGKQRSGGGWVSAKYDPSIEHDAYRNAQINQPIRDRSGKWRKQARVHHYEMFRRFFGQSLIRYGYEEDESWALRPRRTAPVNGAGRKKLG